MKQVYIQPFFRGPDEGDGGMRRVFEAMVKYLPEHGWEYTANVEAADVANLHATALDRAALAADLPIVGSCHGLYWTGLYEWGDWVRPVNRNVIEIMRLAEVATAPSRWVANTLRRNLWRDVDVIWHGIEPEDWPRANPQGYALWNKARTDPVSDPADFDRLAAAMPDQPFVTTFGTAAPNVQRTGKVDYDTMRNWILGASVYLATARETFGIGTLEAMAAGVPVVGWDWGGQREILQHLETGYLARPGDYDDLAQGVRWAQENHDFVTRNARDVVEADFHWRDRVAPYADAFARALEIRASTPLDISVVVPCRNVEDWIEGCVGSVMGQGEAVEWELLLGDNQSDDGTWAKLQAFAEHPRVKAFQWPADLHLSGNRNALIAEAQGRVILPLDADDRLQPDALTQAVAALRDRQTDIVYGGVEFHDQPSREHPDGRLWDSGWPVERFHYRSQMEGRNQIPYASAYRKSVWERLGGYRRRCMAAEDADFWCRATSFGAKVARWDGETAGRPPWIIRYANLRPGALSLETERANWWDWFPWSRQPDLTPYGAGVNDRQMPAIFPHDAPTIAVVIPVGPGHAEHAVTAYDSVMAQSFRDWECVVVNDTGHPLPSVPPWATLLTTDGGEGVAAARNLGLSAVAAGGVVFLDADDYLLPTALEELWQAAQQIGESGPGFIYPDWVKDDGVNAPEVMKLADWSPERLVAQAVHGVTALYPTRRLRMVGGFDATLPCWEDWDLAFKLADDGLCAYHLDRPLFVYRMALGQRREENYANLEAGKVAIRDKWSKYIDGGATMPCSRCPGKVPRPPVGMSTQQAHQSGADQAVWVEYLGEGVGTVQYRGAGTGTQYSFGNNAGHKQMMVHSRDVPTFEGRAEFRVLGTHPDEAIVIGANVGLRADVPTADPRVTDTPPPPPPPAPPVPPDEQGLSRTRLQAMNVDQLRGLMLDRGLHPARKRKGEMIDAILDHDAAIPA